MPRQEPKPQPAPSENATYKTPSYAAQGIERDFQSPASESWIVAGPVRFKSRARNHLQANRSLAFRFEIIA